MGPVLRRGIFQLHGGRRSVPASRVWEYDPHRHGSPGVQAEETAGWRRGTPVLRIAAAARSDQRKRFRSDRLSWLFGGVHDGGTSLERLPVQSDRSEWDAR